MSQPCFGEDDVVYFSLYNPKTFRDPENLREYPEYIGPCLLLKIIDVVKKYKYFFISRTWEYVVRFHLQCFVL